MLFIENPSNFPRVSSGEVFFKYPLNNLCFFGYHFQTSSIQLESKRCLAGIELPFLHPHPIAPTHSFRDGFALPLCQRCEHGCQDLAGGLGGVDVLLLEIYADAQCFQLPHCFQTFFGISGKAGGGLHEDAVNTSFPAVFHHSQEVLTFFYGRAGDPLVGVDIYKFPIGVIRDELGVIGVLSNE